MTENGICIDGRLTKISEDLVFEYDRADMMKPVARAHAPRRTASTCASSRSSSACQ